MEPKRYSLNHLTTDDLVERFCDKSGITAPNSIDDTRKLLNRMRAVGMISDAEVSEHLEKKQEEEMQRTGIRINGSR